MAKKIWEAKTREEHIESLMMAYERLRNLPNEKQWYISQKYHNGLKPWAKTAKHYIDYCFKKYKLKEVQDCGKAPL